MNKSGMRTRYIIIFIALLFLCMFFPYTGDDWAWGSSIGIDRLKIWFDNYSGRYFGNLIVLVLTRSVVVRTIVMAGCLTGTIFMINKLSGNEISGFFISLICLLIMPVAILRQAVVWTAGFANYSTSIFLTLIYIYYTRNIYEQEKPQYSRWTIVPLFLLGIGNTLIVEHLTIYNVILGTYIIAITWIRFKKIYYHHIAYSLGTILGTVYMFSNSVYQSVANGTDGYRSIGSEQGIILKAINSYLDVIMKEGFLNNVVLNVFIAVGVFLIWKKKKEQCICSARKIGEIMTSIIVAYATLSVMDCIGLIEELKVLLWIEGVVTVVYVCALFIFIYILPVSNNVKLKLEFILISVGCMMAPLLVVSPIGSRCFFASYVMQIWLVLELFQILEIDTGYSKEFLRYGVIITGLSFGYLCYIYGTIRVSDIKRVEQAHEDIKVGEKEIEVENMPYEKYLWCPNPDAGTVWEERFKLFYGIDQDIIIHNIPSKLQ